VVIGSMAGALSYMLRANIRLIQQIMGVLLVVLGLHMIGAINIPFLNYTRRLELRPASNLGYLRSLLIGMGFGFGWTPCIGPTLGLILTLALNGQEAQAFLPGIAYSVGLGIPFLVTAMAMGQISAGLKKLTRRSYSLRLGNWTVIDEVNIISLVSGLLLILMGVLIFTNALTLLTAFAPNFGI
jgi:cytochrome c-type biogenesis protein